MVHTVGSQSSQKCNTPSRNTGCPDFGEFSSRKLDTLNVNRNAIEKATESAVSYKASEEASRPLRLATAFPQRFIKRCLATENCWMPERVHAGVIRIAVCMANVFETMRPSEDGNNEKKPRTAEPVDKPSHEARLMGVVVQESMDHCQ